MPSQYRNLAYANEPKFTKNIAMNQLTDSKGGYEEHVIDTETLLKDPNCSAEIIQSYAERLDDEKLLNLIYRHQNCPINMLNNLIIEPIGSL